MASKEYTITINDTSINIFKKKIKNIHFTIYPPEGRVRVAAPLRMSEAAIRLAIISKMAWITKKLKYFENIKYQKPLEYITGETHYFLGQRYSLFVSHKLEEVRGKKTKKNPHITIAPNQSLIMHIDKDATVRQREKVLYDWYKNELKSLVPNLIEKWEAKMQVHIDQYRIKKMKTRWGTCNPNAKRIWLNLELIKKPLYCIEYIIVHELVHLIERSHNHVFVSYMNHYLPNWKAIKEELNKAQL